jgi:hypothetical protein
VNLSVEKLYELVRERGAEEFLDSIMVAAALAESGLDPRPPSWSARSLTRRSAVACRSSFKWKGNCYE